MRPLPGRPHRRPRRSRGAFSGQGFAVIAFSRFARYIF
ncbi:hypothetical protein P355_1182 [Burkholderia cenocepacia KC-01]|nr:hypothetical protein P355_1182 [Burkholderia cenocepacia KC-01]